MNASQLLTFVIRPVLLHLEPEIPGSKAAEQLLLGTAMQESRLEYIDQLAPGPGPAYGFWQMERLTHDDIWDNYLRFNNPLKNKMILLKAAWQPSVAQCATNLAYACGMARVHYRRRPEALPPVNDLLAQASYWKKHYNTHLGKGTVGEYMSNAKQSITIA